MEYIDSERRLMHRPGLEQRFARKTRPRIDAPQRKSSNPQHAAHLDHQPEPISQDYWQRLSDKLEFALAAGPVYWQELTDPQRLLLFCRSLDELRSQCEMEGLRA
ncbi:hypothetical protein SynWH8103_01818 [Synechococcus sp. WH 8103]|nr:hypothetical protein SynWH8103_01818 [Synechococcus sp. WH 8103]